MKTFRNPVLPGFHPDPSAIRVGEDYYLVTSSFEYFPGVPLFHSKDLVHWQQLGHVLDRASQLNLDGIMPSRGIWAPTIRYHKGTFYMITTFVDNEKKEHNFYVTTTDPSGDWSDPIWLDDAPGIDPSLFFDEDGRAYYTGNRIPPEGQEYPKHMDIWLQEIDLEQGKLIGEKVSIWQGALKVAHAQEGPHIYKKDDWYYLLIAEGGTGHTHAVTIARSRNITGPYEGHRSNPILTHRHLGRAYPIVNVGHAELIETQQGEWWLLCLASRTAGGYYRNLGRETFMAPVQWEQEWPVVSPGVGRLELETKSPNLPEVRWPSAPIRDDFDESSLSPIWNFLRTPRGEFWSLTERPGHLRLRLKQEQLSEQSNPAFVGRRQQHLMFNASTHMEFNPQNEGETAGLTLFHNQNYHFRMELALEQGKPVIRLVERQAGVDKFLISHPWSDHHIQLRVVGLEQEYSFYYRANEYVSWSVLFEKADGRLLSTDRAGGFTGTYIGLYGSKQAKLDLNEALNQDGNHHHNLSYVDFDWFDYKEIAKQ
ncbi:glycoside hydrolase family 43 protein [Paenibacillus amylolyticus]|nr:glycoside hydrolase family 43 protein [Paenibacillus amylolyticus]WFR60928.1 glycoside hydrolase family 43 protein [Paenibacillus amylolyticus]